jgi:hypothetical protein
VGFRAHPHIKFVSLKLRPHVNWKVGSLLVTGNLVGSMSWNEENMAATLIRKKEKSTHDGGWNPNPTSIPASTAGLLVGSDRPWTIRTDPSNSPTSSAASSPRVSHSDSTAPSFPSTPASSLSLAFEHHPGFDDPA